MWKYFNLGKIDKPEWTNLTSKRQVAIDYCLSELKFYEEWGRHNRIHWKIWLNIAMTFWILATILAVIPSTFF